MDNDNKPNETVWLQITSGQGPKECGWVVAQLARLITQSASRHELNLTWVECAAFDPVLRDQGLIDSDAYLSVLLRLDGKQAEYFSRQWVGTIQWQGKSPYRPKHKRMNWFVGVTINVSLEPENARLVSIEKDIKVETMRSKGPGGQHVNKTNSAVRITHWPTGLQVRVDSDRSQHRNKKMAIERLQLLLEKNKSMQGASMENLRWQKHYDVKRGDPVRCFYGEKFNEKK